MASTSVDTSAHGLEFDVIGASPAWGRVGTLACRRAAHLGVDASLLISIAADGPAFADYFGGSNMSQQTFRDLFGDPELWGNHISDGEDGMPDMDGAKIVDVFSAGNQVAAPFLTRTRIRIEARRS